MEQEINKFIEKQKNSKSFKLLYLGQKVKHNSEFTKWYNDTNKKLKEENLRIKYEALIQRDGFHSTVLYIISLCPYCISYSICSYDSGFCFIVCESCNTRFCIGCYKKARYKNDNSVCLKGYIKLFYLRTIYRRSYLWFPEIYHYIMHVFICLFLTPFIIGLISNFMGLVYHTNKKRKKDEKYKTKEDFQNSLEYTNYLCKENEKEGERNIKIFLYSICRGLLMFPYEITIFPFMVLLLLPSIFSRKYYLTIFVMYITALMPEGGYLNIDL